MCQLAAYVGDRPIAPLLLRALELQEPYYGAHATGLGVIDEGVLRVEKDFGHVRRVMNTTSIASLEGTAGIAHSRYNGRAKDDPRYNTRGMAHPFVDETGKIALMHNGGIANYREHWERLRGDHTFGSYSAEVDDITDSEVAVHMLEEALDEGMYMEEGLRSVASQITGSFLLGVITAEQPETVWIANWHQPCVVAVGEDEAMFCSSHIGFHDVREELGRVFEPPKNSLLKLTRGKVEVTPLDPNRKAPNHRIDRNELGRSILAMLGKAGRLDFRQIGRALFPEEWARAYGVSVEKMREQRRAGVGFVNPYIEVVDMLIAEGKIREQVDLRSEGGVPDTPRFSYTLV
jgi:glucosamine 6-phosphate synthetase-like amidotransferase/phosphosugar isomerase protein